MQGIFYTYKQIGMPSLELFWPCSILAKNLGDVLARGLSIVLLYIVLWEIYKTYCVKCKDILFVLLKIQGQTHQAAA